ncbi:MAG: peptide chain release factor N(5)-glutamine methyltransferase [Ruminococcaceae bacterium]|nr:peptide chain release factor N(5)-glutamine methyltransferase [Oscillospiraceae bacterium]
MTIEQIYKKLCDELKKAGADSPAFDTIWLMESVLGTTRQDITIYGEKPITEEQTERLFELAKKRIAGEPLQYIIGYWEFFGRRFYVGEGVLIPRDDTEVVLTSVFPFLKERDKSKPLKILDLCSGSGILAITLKKEYPLADVTAVEISDDAVSYLRKNAEYLGADINIIHDDIFNCVGNFPDSEFDLIISNPPYVRTFEMQELQKEVSYEPALALEGGEDGCDFYRKIVPLYTRKLKAGGMLAFEYDGNQADVISKLMSAENFENIMVFDDLGGVHRAINGTLRSV